MHSSSFYGRRPSYVAASWNRRLYPVGDSDPRLAELSHRPSAASASENSSRQRSDAVPRVPSRPVEDAAQQQAQSMPDRPPPVYFRGDSNRGETVVVVQHADGSQTRSSINKAHSQLAVVAWQRHIAFEDGWTKYLRVVRWWRVTRREREVLSSSWPRQFSPSTVSAGFPRSATSRSHDGRTSLSTPSEPDSGIALTPCASMTNADAQHTLAPLFVRRIEYLNEIIPETLVGSRLWLGVLEVLNLLWLVLLVVALGADKGSGGFVSGVAIAFVMIIIVDGAVINAVRMRRWALLRQLRLLSRDWSPLPITSSTNQALVQNYLGQTDGIVGDDEEASSSPAAVQVKDEPVMRWSMTRTEGGWWLSWRPVIRVELITPSTAIPLPVLESADPPSAAVPPPPIHEFPADEEAPAYTR